MIAKFATADDLMAHYATVRARLHGPAPRVFVHPSALPPPPPEPEPEPEIVVPLMRMPVVIPLPHEVRIQFDEVVGLVCDHRGYHRREVFAERRVKHLCATRQIIWALARKFCWHMSLPQIGRSSGKKDHTTVLHGIKKGEIHPDFAKLCEVLERLYEEKQQVLGRALAQSEAEMA